MRSLIFEMGGGILATCWPFWIVRECVTAFYAAGAILMAGF